MQHDPVIWQLINNGFCSFKTKTKTQNFCRNKYNVTGLCNRQSCPLANSRYCTIREEEGHVYLCMKTIERAHTPAKLWERVRLSKNFAEAIQQINDNLQYWPKWQIRKAKQRFTRITQYLIKMRRLRLKAGPQVVPRMNQKRAKRERTREAKAEMAAKISRAVTAELLSKLRSGAYDDIYNLSDKDFNKALDEEELEDDEALEDEDEVEPEMEREMELELEMEDGVTALMQQEGEAEDAAYARFVADYGDDDSDDDGAAVGDDGDDDVDDYGPDEIYGSGPNGEDIGADDVEDVPHFVADDEDDSDAATGGEASPMSRVRRSRRHTEPDEDEGDEDEADDAVQQLMERLKHKHRAMRVPSKSTKAKKKKTPKAATGKGRTSGGDGSAKSSKRKRRRSHVAIGRDGQ